MRLRLFLLLLLLMIAIPLGVMAWLGARLAAEEAGQIEHRFVQVLTLRLQDQAGRIQAVLDARRAGLAETIARLGPAPTGEALRRSPLPRPFRLDAAGLLTYPNPAGDLSVEERSFLVRTRPIWDERALTQPPARGDGPGETSAPTRDDGWYTWHWGNGLNLLYWRRTADGGEVGSEIDQLAILAEVIGALPHEGGADERIRLMDGRNRILYQWGAFEPAEGAAPRAQLSLAPPLDGWRLEYLSPAAAGGRAGARLQLLSGLGVLGLALAGMGFFLYRELTRAMREATQRVSFVNQVSHELKTPLTNIRLYAELLQTDLEGDEAASKRLGVIVEETRRLSRLIGNVLSFARGQRGALRLNRSEAALDDCVRDVIEQFAPALNSAGIRCETRLDAPRPIPIDPDAIRQIIGNLLSNVEKYAAGGGGGWVGITTRVGRHGVELVLEDRGPGIPRAERRKLFRPFYRVRSDTAEGVSGAGLGLSIARDLARLHGGDLVLADAPAGARFVLSIPGGAP